MIVNLQASTTLLHTNTPIPTQQFAPTMPLTNAERYAAYTFGSMHVHRLGREKPAENWYANDADTGEAEVMTYNHHRFIQGHNIDAAKYLILRDFAVTTIHSTMATRIIYDADTQRYSASEPMPLWQLKLRADSDEEDNSKRSYWKTYQATIEYDYLWPIYNKLSAHEYLRDSTAPLYWKEPMAFKFINNMVTFIIKTLKNDLYKELEFPSWPAYPAHRFKWHTQNLSPSKQKDKVQFQDTSIKIADRTTTEEKFSRIEVVALVPKNKQPKPSSRKDIDVEDISFPEFLTRLTRKGFVVNQHDIQFQHPSAGNRMVPITNSKQFIYAVSALREHGVRTIKMYIVRKINA